jgi:hypothetical protein
LDPRRPLRRRPQSKIEPVWPPRSLLEPPML